MSEKTQDIHLIDQTFDLLDEKLKLSSQWAWLFKQAAIEMSSLIMKMSEEEIRDMKQTFNADAQQYLLNLLHEGITNKTHPLYNRGKNDDQV